MRAFHLTYTKPSNQISFFCKGFFSPVDQSASLHFLPIRSWWAAAETEIKTERVGHQTIICVWIPRATMPKTPRYNPVGQQWKKEDLEELLPANPIGMWRTRSSVSTQGVWEGERAAFPKYQGRPWKLCGHGELAPPFPALTFASLHKRLFIDPKDLWIWSTQTAINQSLLTTFHNQS